MIVLLGLFTFGIRKISDRYARSLPPSVESELQTLIGKLLQKRIVSPSHLSMPIERVMKKIQKGMKVAYPYNLTAEIQCNSIPNAFAVPGGTVVITSRALEMMESENMLAIVLAHEIGHFVHRDHAAGVSRALVSLVAFSLFPTTISDFLNFGANFSEGKMSQEQETKADLFSINLIKDVYGHLTGTDQFFLKMKQLMLKEKAKNDQKSEAFSTHPLINERLSLLQSYIAREKPGKLTPLSLDKKELRTFCRKQPKKQ